MKLTLNRNSIFFLIVCICFVWNLFLLSGVVLNVPFVQSRAAGGQFTNFPLTIRIIYFLQLMLVFYQAWTFVIIFNGQPGRPRWIPRFFFFLGIIGIMLNAASKSTDERWNVIPAAIITWAFWNYGVKQRKSRL